MTGGGGGVGEDIKGGELRKFLDTRKGGTEKNVGLGRGGGGGRASENLYTSKPTHDIIIHSTI